MVVVKVRWLEAPPPLRLWRKHLATMGSLVEAGHSAAKRAANQRTLLAVDDPANAGPARGGSADDQRALSPRPMAAPVARSRQVLRGIRSLAKPAGAHAINLRDCLATDHGVTNDGMLPHAAGHDNRCGKRVGPEQ